MSAAENVASVLKPVSELDTVKAAVQHGIEVFVEGLPGVLKALDKVASIHPFLQG